MITIVFIQSLPNTKPRTNAPLMNGSSHDKGASKDSDVMDDSSEEMELRSFMRAHRSNPAYWSITECHQILKSRHRPLASNSTTATPSRARRGSGSPGLRASWVVPVEDAHMANISSDVT